MTFKEYTEELKTLVALKELEDPKFEEKIKELTMRFITQASPLDLEILENCMIDSSVTLKLVERLRG